MISFVGVDRFGQALVVRSKLMSHSIKIWERERERKEVKDRVCRKKVEKWLLWLIDWLKPFLWSLALYFFGLWNEIYGHIYHHTIMHVQMYYLLYNCTFLFSHLHLGTTLLTSTPYIMWNQSLFIYIYIFMFLFTSVCLFRSLPLLLTLRWYIFKFKFSKCIWFKNFESSSWEVMICNFFFFFGLKCLLVSSL